MERRIRILHTNDIHSHLHRTPQIMTVMRTLRQHCDTCGDAVVTVDIGDHMDRMRAETEGTNGQVNVAIMNETQYDYITLGNNEGLTFPRDALNRMYEHASFQVVLSNWFDLHSRKRPKWMVPYVIREWFGCRVAIIGVTIPFNDFYRLLGWTVTDPIDVISTIVSELREEHGVNVVVVLSHLGYHNDEQLCEQVRGVDVILGGHTHHLLETVEERNGTFMAAAGKFGDYVGEVTLTVDDETGELLDVSGGCHSVTDAHPDERIGHLLRDYNDEAERRLSQPVIQLKAELPVDWEGESPFGNLLADSLMEQVNAEMAVVNTGQLLAGLPLGTVTLRDLHRICPSPINPCRMRIRGGDLRQALEESLLTQFQQMSIRGFGFRGKQLGSLAIAGMTVTYRCDAPPYRKIVEIRIGRELLRDDRTYQIGTIDMFTFGIGYKVLKYGVDVEFYLPDFLRDLLAKRLKRADNIKEAFQSRWHRLD